MTADWWFLAMAAGAMLAAVMEGSDGSSPYPADRGYAALFVALVALVAAGVAWAILHLGVVR